MIYIIDNLPYKNRKSQCRLHNPTFLRIKIISGHRDNALKCPKNAESKYIYTYRRKMLMGDEELQDWSPTKTRLSEECRRQWYMKLKLCWRNFDNVQFLVVRISYFICDSWTSVLALLAIYASPLKVLTLDWNPGWHFQCFRLTYILWLSLVISELIYGVPLFNSSRV